MPGSIDNLWAISTSGLKDGREFPRMSPTAKESSKSTSRKLFKFLRERTPNEFWGDKNGIPD